MSNKPGGIIFDHFGKSLKLLKKNYQKDANDRRLTRRRGRGLHLFTILPHSKFQKKFILIDSTALYNLLSITNYCGRFGFSIMTTVNVNLRKEILKENIKINSYGFDENENFYHLNISEGGHVAGLDPGRKYLFVAIYGNEKKNYKKCSTKGWYSLAGFTRIRIRK
ncbi:12484_t:CDS:2 [Entrophospora sp. SA101]|nr:12484_t:CDS:2 [Entrophospora sp. SA101]